MVNIRLSHCNLRARDLDEAVAFYRDVIGLEVRADIPLGAGRWLTVGPPGQPEIEVILEPMTFAGNTQDEQVLRSLMERHVIQTLIFLVDDCDATFERVKAEEIVQALRRSAIRTCIPRLSPGLPYTKS
jgi:predicted enzyme related to lactoylglutathione lyase